MTAKIDKNSFKKIVSNLTGQRYADCYQCGKCTAGCPMADDMDIPPHKIIRMIQLGKMDEVLSSFTIWLCATCEMCTSRCPQKVLIAETMDALRQLALEKGYNIPKQAKNILKFHNAFLSMVKKFGRLHEFGLVQKYKLMTFPYDQFKDLFAGISMFKQRKISPFGPKKLKGMDEIKRIFDKCCKE